MNNATAATGRPKSLKTLIRDAARLEAQATKFFEDLKVYAGQDEGPRPSPTMMDAASDIREFAEGVLGEANTWRAAL